MNRQPKKLNPDCLGTEEQFYLLPMAIGTPSEIDTFALINNNS